LLISANYVPIARSTDLQNTTNVFDVFRSTGRGILLENAHLVQSNGME
jgi:hypothetical protein